MALKVYKPTTPARRGMTRRDTSELTTKRPLIKSLLVAQPITAGRNHQGKITIRHRGGGVKRFYRLVDFRFAAGAEAVVKSIEYDPNRSGHIAALELADGRMAYILAAAGLKVGDRLHSGDDADIRRGNRLPLEQIPVGTQIFNIELTSGRGGQLVRSAGARAQLMAKEGAWCQVRLPSGEVRLIHQRCLASVGAVSNETHQNVKYGSAGRRRKMGWRPSVRGSAMNPVDHPQGGGEGQQSVGIRGGAKTPWGKVALGLRTRRRKLTNAMIVRRRKSGRRGK